MPLFKNKKVENSWSFKESLADALIASLEDGLLVYDSNFKVIQLNKAAEEIFNVKAAEVTGKVFSLDKAKNFKSQVMAQVMFSSLAPMVVRRSEPGESVQILDLTLSPQRNLRVITAQITDDGGQLVGFVKLVKDLTREVELIKAKSDFITMAAHQLRTPAIGLKWALDNLVKTGNLSGENQETLVTARGAAQNLLTIINDLIELSQLDDGKFAYQFQDINLNDFLTKLLASADLIAKEYNIKVYFNPPTDKSLTIFADPNRLGVAISNFIDNALKYNVKGGEVTVTVKTVGKKAEISIKDTGIGISEEDLKKIFNKFYRGRNVGKTGVVGSGLGLYLAKNIIEAHKGQVKVESVLGRGTTFFIILPYAGTA